MGKYPKHNTEQKIQVAGKKTIQNDIIYVIFQMMKNSHLNLFVLWNSEISEAYDKM